MGAAASASRVVLAGNDGAGKTWLLTRAKLATTAQATAHRLPGGTIATIGVSHEHVRPVAAHPHLEVLDVGGGCRSGLLFVNAATTADGLVFVLRATDARLYSALWELYAVGASSATPPTASATFNTTRSCTRQHRPAHSYCTTCPTAAALDPHSPVCVAIIVDTALPPWIGLPAGQAAGPAGEMWPHIAAFAAREALPPGGTDRWSDERRWASGSAAPPAAAPADACVDAECWLPEWEADRRGVLASASTSSHGCAAKAEPTASPPLSGIHTGTWVVLPIDPVGQPADAMQPFVLIAEALAALRTTTRGVPA